MRDQINAMSSTSGKQTHLVPNASYSLSGNVYKISRLNLAQNGQLAEINITFLPSMIEYMIDNLANL